MKSSEIDPALILLAPDGKRLAINDDISPKNFNARINLILPQNGIYTLIARSSQPGESGRYRLAIR